MEELKQVCITAWRHKKKALVFVLVIFAAGYYTGRDPGRDY